MDKKTFSINYETLKANITKKTKAIMLVNVLGNCSEIDKIRSIANKKKIYLIEDNCESLGSIYKNKPLGSFGDFSTFSFYYTHQITSGEGGMIVCNNQKDYEIKLDKQLIDSEQSISEQHHEGESSPCGM